MHTLPLIPPKGVSKSEFVVFVNKIEVHLKKVCYKVSLCETPCIKLSLISSGLLQNCYKQQTSSEVVQSLLISKLRWYILKQLKLTFVNITVYVCVIDSGQTPAEAEANFLIRACQLDTYGVDPHPVKVTVQTALLKLHKH